MTAEPLAVRLMGWRSQTLRYAGNQEPTLRTRGYQKRDAFVTSSEKLDVSRNEIVTPSPSYNSTIEDRE
jgi:hypothetical protein